MSIIFDYWINTLIIRVKKNYNLFYFNSDLLQIEFKISLQFKIKNT